MEVWHLYVDGVHTNEYYFPEEENLEVLLEEIIEDVESEERRVATRYIQPDNHEVRLYTTRRSIPDDEGWWTL
jgi:hypothetical protein